MFDRQPTLTDGSLVLRPLIDSDLPALRAAASDPFIWAGHPATDRFKPGVFDALFTQLIAFQGALIVLRDGAVIGSSTYYTGSTQPGTIAIGYTFLVRSEWGGATNFAMKTLMLEHAFNSFDSVWLHIGPTNIRSQKATQKIGGVYRFTEQMNTSGGSTDMQFYEVTRLAWRNRIGQ